jgi:DNA (cytosine-5)-methyltransferase 1
MNELALFAGAGGGILGGHLLGWRTVCAVERDAYAASVLVARQNDGCLAPFPIWDDVRTFDGRPWRGVVDVVSGGFPCQDISSAGKGAGIEGERSGLWSEMARIIGEVRPRFAFMENSPMLAVRGLGRVIGDLAEMGYDARWGCVSAADAIFALGDPATYHGRERIWIAAADTAQSGAWQDIGGIRARTGGTGRGPRAVAKDRDSNGNIRNSIRRLEKRTNNATGGRKSNWWKTQPAVGRVVDGMASRVDRLRAIGNGQVPHVAELAWNLLTEDWNCGK